MRGHDWDAIRQKYPLMQIVGKVTKLTKSGNEWKCCCPIHKEKTPSFTIYNDGLRYHCFGCGAGGDVVDFVSAYDGVDHAEAVSRLTGGKPPEYTEEDRVARKEWLASKDKERQLASADAVRRANSRWDRSKPVEGENAYLERKKVAPYGCRAEGKSLLVPMWDSNGDLVNVQTIPPEAGGKKLFEKNSTTAGARFYIGVPFGKTVICEGFATGASIYEATADRVCIAFSKDNIPRVARELKDLGVDIIIAADRTGMAQMIELGENLGVPVAVPPEMPNDEAGKKRDDFNDLAVMSGIEEVSSVIRQALFDYASKPALPEIVPEPECAISFVSAFDFEESSIPSRPWIVPGMMLAGATHILAAPGGTGKSLFTLQMGMMLATGQSWGKWKAKRGCNVLIVNAEDDIDEQRRRLSAARSVMELDTSVKMPGKMLIADNPSNILMSAMDPARKIPVATPLVRQMRAMIEYHSIDVVIVDPFAETFEGDENSNNDTKWAMKVWRDEIARATGCAVYLVHHTTKNAADKAGSADAVRGAGALVNSARLASTLFVMTSDEATDLGVKPEDRFRYVKYDDAKSNQSLIGSRQWFEKVSVVIQNGPAGLSDGGDEVGALRPWSSDGCGDIEPDQFRRIVKAVDDGYVDEHGEFTGLPFLPTAKGVKGGSPRWIVHLITEIAGVEEAQAKRIFMVMKDRSYLSVIDDFDASKGRQSKIVLGHMDKIL